MATIVHPITQIDGSPQYSADNIRKSLMATVIPSNNTAFNGVQGVRPGSPTPLFSISGSTLTLKAHAGVVSPWTGIGAYNYALDADVSITIPSLSSNYKLAMVLTDQSVSHGTTNTVTPTLIDAATIDTAIDGLVLGTVTAGVAADYAPRVSMQPLISCTTLARLNAIATVAGSHGFVTADGTNNGSYTYTGSVWKRYVNTATKIATYGWGDAAVNPATRLNVELYDLGTFAFWAISTTGNLGNLPAGKEFTVASGVPAKYCPVSSMSADSYYIQSGANETVRVNKSGNLIFRTAAGSSNRSSHYPAGTAMTMINA